MRPGRQRGDRVSTFPLHVGDEVTVHAAASQYDGQQGPVTAEASPRHGYTVELAGMPVHFELSELELGARHVQSGGPT